MKKNLERWTGVGSECWYNFLHSFATKKRDMALNLSGNVLIHHGGLLSLHSVQPSIGGPKKHILSKHCMTSVSADQKLSKKFTQPGHKSVTF